MKSKIILDLYGLSSIHIRFDISFLRLNDKNDDAIHYGVLSRLPKDKE